MELTETMTAELLQRKRQIQTEPCGRLSALRLFLVGHVEQSVLSIARN